MIDLEGNVIVYIGQPWSTGGILIGVDKQGFIIQHQNGSEYHVSDKGFAICLNINYEQYLKNKRDILI